MNEIMKKLDYQPATLTEYELENPSTVVSEFFNNNALHDIRGKVWELYKGWVNYSCDFAEGKENTAMLFFYTQLIDFMNASYLCIEKKKSEP